MSRNFIAVMLLLISSSVVAQKNEWVDLFNGRNLKDWQKLNGDAEYRVENGEIIGTSKANTPNTFLATKKNYGDFILEYEMKMDRGLNSGVQIRSLSKSDYQKGKVHGYQVECDDAERAWSGGIYDEGRRGWLYPLIYNQPARKAYKNGEWNHYRIEAIGNTIRTWLNDIPCANLVDDMTAEGFIALQIHNISDHPENAGKEIRWRNIKIKTTNLAAGSKPMTGVKEVSYLNNVLTAAEEAEGWKLLWDGKTTQGWRGAKSQSFPEKGWEIKDGVLSVVEANGAESTNGGDIITGKKYKDFVLEVDFRITEGANSGIKYFVDPELNKGEGSSIGLEYQILDDKRHPDAKLGVEGYRTLASLYDLIPADARFYDPTAEKKRFNGVGAWNRARIEVKGNIVAHYLNGVKVLQYERGTQEWRALVGYSKYARWPKFGELETGHILLQDHGNHVDFKNIKILEL